MAALNHPKKDSKIKVEPIRTAKDIKAIKRLLADIPRDLAIFTLGINTNLRASDILKVTVGMVRNLKPEDHFTIRETKTDKERSITVNQTVHRAIQCLLATMPDAGDDELLFQSRKGKPRKTILCSNGTVRQPSKGEISVPSLNGMVKGWCKEINLTGNYGSHTLRKTFGYMHRTVNKTDLPTLMTMFNHSSQKQTLKYLCIQPDEIKSAYLFEL
jgi:integrase